MRSIFYVQPRVAGYLLVAVLSLAVFWHSSGAAKQGTIAINTWHTKWSRTDRPYDKQWFGPDSGYNYYCLKQFLTCFYGVKELKARITDEALADVSVLMVYLPDKAFSRAEKEAVRRFVKKGGGLLVIGDHTNIFGSTSHLNALIEIFGLRYRDDVLFDLKEDFFQIIYPSRRDSFLLNGIDVFKFRGPCSIQPVSLSAFSFMEVGQAKSLRAFYAVNNFFPQPLDNPKMKTGRFSVGAAAAYGAGRVCAFGDSTVFSNFEIFYPGKYELLLNLCRWLSYKEYPFANTGRAICAVLLLGLIGLGIARIRPPGRLLNAMIIVTVLVLGAYYAANAMQRAQMRFPPAIREIPMLYFITDPQDENTETTHFYSKGDYAQKYDVFFQWALRNNQYPGFYLHGQGYQNAFYHAMSKERMVKKAVVVIVKNEQQWDWLKTVPRCVWTDNKRFLFLIDSRVNAQKARAQLRQLGFLTEADFNSAAPLAEIKDALAISRNGIKTIILFAGEQFSDRFMGYSEKVEPNELQKDLYAKQYLLLNRLFE